MDAHNSAYVEDEICEAYGVQRPHSSKACHNPDCPEWEAGDWTECSSSRCIREETSIQRREVKCVFLNGTEADFAFCNRKTRPKIKKECLNKNCTAEWRPSIWGQCSKKCGDGGVQMRLLRCVWRGTKKAAGRNCDPSTRPSAIRPCEGVELRPCGPGEDVDPRTTKFPREHSSQSNSSLSVVDSALDSPLSDAPFKKLQKWRGWRLYDWDWNRLDDKLKRI
ncbi:hypothetical protein FO519_008865 [Halicephalobus sp. NKZ332]|nr:hypothetical protein FO519_008865 [Halicephalobus sp. NKZ332]